MLKNVALLPLSFLKWLYLVRALPLSWNPWTSRASALSKSIALITNQSWTAFTHPSKSCECVHFLSELPKFYGAMIFITFGCFDNFFCAARLDIPVLDSHCSCSTDLVRCPRWLLFGGQRILLIDKALLDALSLELSNLLWSGSFSPVSYLRWLFLSFLASWSPESLSPSCCSNKVSCSVADLVVNIVLIEVLGALLLSLPLFRVVWV